MAVESAALKTGHGERLRQGTASLLLGFEFSQSHGAEAGIEMAMELVLVTRLAVAQTGELFGIAKQKFDLEAGSIIAKQRQRRECQIGTEQDRLTGCFAAGVDDNNDVKGAFKALMVEHLLIHHHAVLIGLDARKAGHV